MYEHYINTIFPSVRLDDPLIKDFTQFYFSKGWFPARLSKDQMEALYSRLLKNFDANGQKMSYKSADIDRNNFISDYWDISRYWNRYGYNKEWIFYWTAAFLLLFTIITYLLGNILFEHRDENDVVYAVKKIPVLTQPLKFPSRKKIKYALIYTSIIFFSFSLKTENLNFKGNAFFYIVIINVVGLLCLGYLANFILQK